MARILKTKYFPSSSFIEASTSSNPSYIWRSIVWGREALILGLQWKVGSSKGIRVFLDPWIPRPSTFRPITRAPVGLENLRVSDLISNGSWDLDTIASLFWEVDKDAILGIPKCSRKKRDVASAF